MQQNKERQRQVRNRLHRSLPREGTQELELWERNKQSSPLLRLPAELRNRIYELVLCVGQINVCFKRWEHKPRTRNGQRYFETIEGGFGCRILGRDDDPWPPSKTTVEPARPRGMTLLSPVCRQLYHETAVLPFSLNAWSFESPYVMDRYVMKEKRLSRAQRRAIRVLYSQTVLPVAVEKYFGGLEVLALETGIVLVKPEGRADTCNGGRGRSMAWEKHPHPWK